MADETKDLDFDLDEDLFDFGEASLADVFDGEDDADLDEIFAAFQEAHVEPPAEEEAEEEEADEELFPTETEPVSMPGPAPAPAKVWTPESAIEDEPAPRRKVAVSRREPTTVVASAGLSRSALWALVAITSINALVAIVTFASMSTMRNSMVEVGRHVAATADEIRTGAYEQSRVLNELQTPIVPIDPDQHPTFDRARAEISQGQYSEARRRLYALLSIIDRLDPDQRAKVEARAQFLLAEALHLEALENMEAEQ